MKAPVIVDLTKGGHVSPGLEIGANPLAGKRRTGKIAGIVIHHTGGGDAYSAMVAGQGKGVQHGTGSQFYIDRDGTIYRRAADGDVTSGIRNPKSKFRTDKGQPTAILNNENVLNIEVVAPDSQHFTAAQNQSVAALSGYLAGEYEIPASLIVGHGQLQGGAGGNKQSTEGTAAASYVRSYIAQQPEAAALAAIDTATDADAGSTVARTQRVNQLQSEVASTRRDPLSPRLAALLTAVGDEADVYFDVVSGGQHGESTTGSSRHDHGDAADLKAYTLNADGSKHYLDFTVPADQAKWSQIVQLSVAGGATGIGAGTEYMGNTELHIGYQGEETYQGVWGAGGRAANAPAWLVSAYDAGLHTPPMNIPDVATELAVADAVMPFPYMRRLGPVNEFDPLPAPEPLTVDSLARARGQALEVDGYHHEINIPGLDRALAAERNAPRLTHAGNVPEIQPLEENANGGFDIRNTALYGVRRPPGAPRTAFEQMQFVDPGTGEVISDDMMRLGQPAAETGSPATGFNTVLSAADEKRFQTWRRIYAPNDTGEDYDLRGAFAAGLTPDPETGHWPDTYKKPNHPTFSVESEYAQFAPELAGSWVGDTYMPSFASSSNPRTADVYDGIFDGTPLPADGLIVEHAGSVGGRDVMAVSGEHTPQRGVIQTGATRVTRALLNPTSIWSDPSGLRFVVPKTMTEALKNTPYAPMAPAIEEHLQKTSPPIKVEQRPAAQKTSLAEVHPANPQPTIAATGEAVSSTKVAGQSKMQVIGHPKVGTEGAYNIVGAGPDYGALQRSLAATKPAAPTTRTIIEQKVNPAYTEYQRKYGSITGGANPILEDIHDRRESAIVVAQQSAPRPAVPPPPPKTIPVRKEVPVAPAPAQRVAQPPGVKQSVQVGGYVIQRGDTLSAIAKAHGTTVAELQRANGINDPNVIYAGKSLVIPGNAPSGGGKTKTSGSPPNPTTSTGGKVYVSKSTGKVLTPYTLTTYNPDTQQFESRTAFH